VVTKSAGPSSVAPSPAPEQDRPLRSDARRNRQRVLEAAESLFAAEGVDVPVDEIAERAGVGVGTLYRHFPTKEVLFEAILVARVGEIAEDARQRLGAEDPGSAFFGFVEHLVAETARKRDLINAFATAGVELAVVAAEAKKDLEAATTALLHAAQRAGAVRPDVSAALVLSLIGATCMAADRPHPEVSPNEMLTVVCDGLRTARGDSPPQPTLAPRTTSP
jgi:AcrR family transcriptional regulator